MKCRQKLGFQLTVQTVAGIVFTDVAAYVRVEQNRVTDSVTVLAEATNGDINVNARALVDNAERYRGGRAVLIANELFRVKIVDTLIFGRLAAERSAFADVLERV